MATIVIKNKATASSAPLVGDLVEGELAVNTVDGLIWTRDDSNNLVGLGVIKQGATTNKMARFDGTNWIPAAGVALTAGGTLTAAGLVATADVACVDVNATGDVGCVDVNATGNSDAASYTGPGSGLTGWITDSVSATAEARTSSGWVDTLEVITTDTVETAPTKIEYLTQAEYDAITPATDTLYFVSA